MSEQQSAAFITAQATCAFVEALGMISENMQRRHRGESMAYCAEDFDRVISKYGIHHNAVLTTFGGAG